MFLYLVTVKSNKMEYISLSHLECALASLRLHSKGYDWSCLTGYELDTRLALHCHTCFRSKNCISVQTVSKEFSDITGMHVHLKQCKIKDATTVMNYCLKEQKCPYVCEDISYNSFIMRQMKRKRYCV